MHPESGPFVPETETHHKAPHGEKEIPPVVYRLTPYEKVRELDYHYEHLATLEALSEDDLEQKIADYQELPEFTEYREMYINFHTMDEAAEAFADSPEGQSAPELGQKLKDAIAEIKISVSNYYVSVMAFDRASVNKFRMDDFEYKENMVQVDQRRTIAHNRLIDAIVSYTRLVNKLIPDQTGYRFDHYALFEPQLILDLRSKQNNLHKPARDKIATWAFLNERGIHVERAVEKAQQVLENKRAARV